MNHYDDRMLSFHMMLLVNRGKDDDSTVPKDKNVVTLPFPDMIEELQAYINSKEYRQLMINELEEIMRKRREQNRNI